MSSPSFNPQADKAYGSIVEVFLYSPSVAQTLATPQHPRLPLLRITFKEGVRAHPEAERIMDECSDIIALLFVVLGFDIEGIWCEFNMDVPAGTLTFYQLCVNKEQQEAHFRLLADFFTSLMRWKYHKWRVVSVSDTGEHEAEGGFRM